MQGISNYQAEEKLGGRQHDTADLGNASCLIHQPKYLYV